MCTEAITEYPKRAIEGIMGQREEIARAFVAKHGFHPDECIQVQQQTAKGARWYIRKMTPEEQAQRLMYALPAQRPLMPEEGLPEWWPENPYPATFFPMTQAEYAKAMPDERLRTAISGCLGRLFWGIASEQIADRLRETINESDCDDL